MSEYSFITNHVDRIGVKIKCISNFQTGSKTVINKITLDDSIAGEFPLPLLRGIKGKEAIKAFVNAGGVERSGKGDHVNIKMPNGQIITIPVSKELKIGLLKAAIKKAGLTEEEFMRLLKRR